MDLEKTVRNLKARHFLVSCFASGKEAVDYLKTQINETTVGIGRCKTADQLGLYDVLSENNQVFWHWRSPGMDTLKQANAADVYITGANAISEDGEILNIDGRGNRLAGQVFGNKRVFIIAGTNKICPDFESALSRAHNIATPLFTGHATWPLWKTGSDLKTRTPAVWTGNATTAAPRSGSATPFWYSGVR